MRFKADKYAAVSASDIAPELVDNGEDLFDYEHMPMDQVVYYE